MAVDRADVAHAERLEEGRRLEVLAHRGLERLHALLGLGADEGQVAQELLHAPLPPHVDRVEPDRREAVGELRDGRRVGATVVVEHDDDVAVAVAEVVQRLVRHAAGHRAVPDDGDDVPALRIGAAVTGHGQPVGVGQDRRGVAVLDEVVLGLLPRGVAREPAGLPELLEPGRAAGDDLVHVRLVPGVPQDGVAGRVEDAVESEGQLDRAEVRAQVAAVLGHGGDDEVADLAGQLVELFGREPAQVGGLVDGVEQHAGPTLPPRCGREGVVVRCRRQAASASSCLWARRRSFHS